MGESSRQAHVLTLLSALNVSLCPTDGWRQPGRAVQAAVDVYTDLTQLATEECMSRNGLWIVAAGVASRLRRGGDLLDHRPAVAESRKTDADRTERDQFSFTP